ncbi:unnamed protein product [Mytilus coruscus]|uniref:MAM domain-containing protein n=1 Tax=Mytilus coruscus TaxID=42192 RepID=A0A6J8AVR9_MYTCO|nr:unnamed protein product [Mytilus coruscus]
MPAVISVSLNITGGFFQNDTYLKMVPMLDICNIGPKQCVKDCMLHYGCYAVNYDNNSLHCELLNHVGPYYDLSIREGMHFSKVNDGWMQDENSCWPNPCTGRTKCVAAYNKQYICVTYDLETPTDKFSCGFETDTPCVFKDSKQDDFDWTRHSGNTSSVDTAADGFYYIYTEVSGPREYGKKAILTTEATALQCSNKLVSILPVPYEGEPGTLEVFAGGKTSSLTSVWVKTGVQPDQDKWKSAIIDIPQFCNPVITIEGVRGRIYKGDIAIDYLTLDAGACKTRR